MLITPTSIVSDHSNYLQKSPFQLSPGVCLSSAYLTPGGLQTSQWRTITSGVMLQNGAERRMTAANHGFPDGQDVYHPHPLGRRIGQIVTRHPNWDIALLQLDPSIAFTNKRYLESPSAQRLIPVNELLFGDWFEVNGISTGRIDLCARSISQYPSLIGPTSDLLDAREWRIEVGFLKLWSKRGDGERRGLWGAYCRPRWEGGRGFQMGGLIGSFCLHTSFGSADRVWLVYCLILV